jgi:serine/threonine-protein kinase
MLGELVLGKYRVTRQLDEGGMSRVYLARQEAPARDAVVKVLKEQLRAQPRVREHFRREIYIMSRFRHPHAVAYYDSSANDPRGPILVMEYLRGVDLNALLHRDGRLTPERAGRLLVQLCDVLQAAHDAGIVHRDIKPGNLMVIYPGTPHETVKLMDFGLAKMSSLFYIAPDELVDFSLPAASGTPEYIAPEMVRGGELDGRGDLYSVGVLLFEMLTGRRPFVRPTVEGLLLAHADERPPRFAEVGAAGAASPALEGVVQACLAKSPEDRPRSAWELAQAYERALGKRIILGARGQAPAAAGARRTGVMPTVGNGKAPAPPPPGDRQAVRQSIEATMPEAMAMLKLKGFIYDLGGEVVESVPGLIRVRLVEREPARKSGGLFGWGGGRRNATLETVGSTDLELHMERRDPTQTSKLTITLVMRPGAGLVTPEWRNRCNQIGRDLQAYLMGR